MSNIKLAIIICTYKREQYVLKNIKILKSECRDLINKVYVIDNGSTLSVTLNDDFIVLIHNRNIGGTGGYARGMYEAHKNKQLTHVMLMDDDIEFSPAILKKAVLRLKSFRGQDRNNWIGFGMVTFDNTNKLFECGAYWNGIKLRSNYKGKKVDNFKIKNVKYNYSAWWSLIMPISVVDRYGYPYPFFIKYDDIEYGLRRTDEKIYFYKDLYVKHENFKNKKNSLGEYYLTRNSLVTNILHLKHDLIKSLLRFLLKTVKMYFCFNFKSIIMANYGIADFLRGPDNFLIDLEKKNLCITEIDKRYKRNIFYDILVLPFKTFLNIFKFIIKHKKLYVAYKDSYNKLISENYWIQLFTDEKTNNKIFKETN